MKQKINFGKIWKFIPILGFFILAYMVYSIGVNKILDSFKIIPVQYYLLAFVLLIPRELLRAYQWQYISKKQKMFFNLLYLIKISTIGFFYCNITPGGVGLHIRLFYLKNKSNATTEKCLTNSLIETTTSFLTGLFISLVGSIILFEKARWMFPILLIFFIFYLTIFVVLLKKSRGKKLFKILLKPLIPKKYREVTDHSVDLLYEDIPRFRDTILPFAVNSLIFIIVGIQTYIVAIPFNLNIPLMDFILISIISAIATGIIPVSVSGLGVREGVFVILAGSYGVAPEVAIAISLAGYIVKSLVLSVIGFVLSVKATKKVENTGKNRFFQKNKI